MVHRLIQRPGVVVLALAALVPLVALAVSAAAGDGHSPICKGRCPALSGANAAPAVPNAQFRSDPDDEDDGVAPGDEDDDGIADPEDDDMDAPDDDGECPPDVAPDPDEDDAPQDPIGPGAGWSRSA